MDFDSLFAIDSPTFYITTLNDSDLANRYLQLSAQNKDAVVRMLRGKKSKTVHEFFDEISAALQFPYYFGENWAALEDCITDLEWLSGTAYLLLLSNAHLLLNTDPEALHILIRLLARAGAAWLTPNKYFPRSRQPTPFHVLFQCPASEVEAFRHKLSQIDMTVVML